MSVGSSVVFSFITARRSGFMSSSDSPAAPSLLLESSALLSAELLESGVSWCSQSVG